MGGGDTLTKINEWFALTIHGHSFCSRLVMYPRSGASNRASFGYAPELDGLRALAMFAVMGLHFAPAIVTAGSLGVDVFLVLSGYLITSILLSEIQRTGALDYKEFLARRANGSCQHWPRCC